jgi:hypothetical protein
VSEDVTPDPVDSVTISGDDPITTDDPTVDTYNEPNLVDVEPTPTPELDDSGFNTTDDYNQPPNAVTVDQSDPVQLDDSGFNTTDDYNQPPTPVTVDPAPPVELDDSGFNTTDGGYQPSQDLQDELDAESNALSDQNDGVQNIIQNMGD